MTVTQIATLTNTAVNEAVGESVILQEDLSNVVDVGTAIFNANAVDNYVRSLIDHIGRMVFVDRVYSATLPSLMMDAWEYGSVCEKIGAEYPEAVENESWELNDQQSYDPYVFNKPNVYVKFFNKRTTFEIDQSITEMQVKESFSSAEQLNRFISMLFNIVNNAMTLRFEALAHRTINNLIAETVHSEYSSAAYAASSGVRAVNLLYLYNQEFGASLTAAAAITTPEFIRFAVYVLMNYMDRLAGMSTLFNIGGKMRFTPKDLQHIALRADFKNAANVYLQSDTFNAEYTALPNADVVPYWQGTGLTYAAADTGKISVTTASGDSVTITGVLGVIYDREAAGITNYNRRTRTAYSEKGEFYNYFHKFEAGYFNDLNENAIVFFVA